MKPSNNEDTRAYNVGNSDYSKYKIQPWDIWKEYQLNPWDADIVKRVLRNKKGEDRRLDYEKIIHVCKERIRQLDDNVKNVSDDEDVDGTTVICPSELDKPPMALKPYAEAYIVYAVFKSNDDYWYAYIGTDAKRNGHIYLQLTGALKWSYVKYDGYPKATLPKSTPIGTDGVHTHSVKIGGAGLNYEKFDYIISEGTLYRYFGVNPKKGYHYKMFAPCGDIVDVYANEMIKNEAEQVTCEK